MQHLQIPLIPFLLYCILATTLFHTVSCIDTAKLVGKSTSIPANEHLELTTNTSSYNYGTIPLNSNKSYTFSIYNFSESSASGCGTFTLTGHPDDFIITDNSCISPMIVAKKGSCQVTVKAAPTTVGLREAILSRTCAKGGVISFSLQVTGTGISSLLINNGEEYTNERLVSISFNALSSGGGGAICLTEDSSPSYCSGSWSTAITSPKNFLLSATNGTKVVYAFLADSSYSVISSALTDSIVLDSTPPAMETATTSLSLPTNTQIIPLTFIANESVEGVAPEEVTPIGGIITNFAANDLNTEFLFELTVVNVAAEATVGITIPSGGYNDLAGNVSISTRSYFVQYDGLPPLATPYSTPGGGSIPLASGTPVTFVYNFNERVTGINESSLTELNVHILAISTPPNNSTPIYSITVMPTTNAGTCAVSIAAGGVRDLAGNYNNIEFLNYTIPDATPPADTVVNDPYGTPFARNIYFTWDGISDDLSEVTYHPRVCTANDCASNCIDLTAVATPTPLIASLSGSSLLLGQNYYACVRTSDASNNYGSYIASTNPFFIDNNARHGGWSDILSIGRKTNAFFTHGTPLATPVTDDAKTYSMCNDQTPPCIMIAWPSFTPIPLSTINAYAVYRGFSSGDASTTPIATILPTPNATNFYYDVAVTPGSFHFYQVRPLVSGTATPWVISTSDYPIREVRVAAAPDNMALVHRWIANREICSAMGRSSDPQNQYACSFSGIGNTGGLYDFGHDLLVDRFELGCNLSRADCAAHLEADGASTTDCIAAVDPSPLSDATPEVYDTFYNRASGVCFLRLVATPAGTAEAWISADALNLNPANATPGESPERFLAASGAHLPPITNIDQDSAAYLCKAQDPITIAGAPISKRLLQRKEQRVAALWNLADHSSMDAMEAGNNFAIPANENRDCNSDTLGGGSSDSDKALNQYPGSDNNIVRAVRTGSGFPHEPSTDMCVSRFGLQDMSGNVDEWLSDELAHAGATLMGQTSSLDSSNTSLNGLQFNNINAAFSNAYSGGAPMSLMSYISYPLGIPVTGAGGTTLHADDLLFNANTYSGLWHNDSYSIRNDDASNKGLIASGNWSEGSGSGATALKASYPKTTNAHTLGTRCALPLPEYTPTP
ncbi:MAG: hypothetical protein HQK52_12295 [Oligoflexia bacterium]|nr:hypothetical protein [Oligoflexia bacterium]